MFLESKMKTLRITVIITIFAILLSACVGSSPTSKPNLEDTTWVLTAYNDNHPIEGTQPSIQFENGQVSGNASCNHYGGSYQIKGDAISFSDLFNTEMACMDPDGVMEQEQIYLDLLRSASRFELVDYLLTLFAGPNQILTFQMAKAELPAGFKEYQDKLAGVVVYIPDSWVVTGIIEGQYAIFLSYPEDKYTGGEMLEPGDTKCDLNIRPPGSSAADLIQQWKSDSFTTIVSEEAIDLPSGKPGIRFELDSMGRSISVITEINERVVVLTCYGDFALVDEIMATLKSKE